MPQRIGGRVAWRPGAVVGSLTAKRAKRTIRRASFAPVVSVLQSLADLSVCLSCASDKLIGALTGGFECMGLPELSH